MKKYRSKKEMPETEVGTIFEEKGNVYVYWPDNSPTYMALLKSMVEDNPEWFEKIDCHHRTKCVDCGEHIPIHNN